MNAMDLISPGDRVLLAVSGGADSVAMADVLVRLQMGRTLCRGLVVGHVNHHLRGEASDADEQWVARLADRWGLPFVCRSVDVLSHSRRNALSIETSARELRLDALVQMAAESGCNRIATAHHADDQAETILHRLQRGTGFRGLCGIAPKRSVHPSIALIRPLLGVTRSNILLYCHRYNLEWRIDATNDSLDHTRNRIRHTLIPHLERMFPRIHSQLIELSSGCQRLQHRIDNESRSAWESIVEPHPDRMILDRRQTSEQPPVIRNELLRRALADLGCGEQKLGHRHYRFLDQLIAGPNGRKQNLPNGFVALIDDEHLILCRQSTGSEKQEVVETELPIPGQIAIGHFQFECQLIDPNPKRIETFFQSKDQYVEWFDLDSIRAPIRIRRRRQGDRFVPFGQQGEKKVGKYLTAQHTSDRVRRRVLIVEDSETIVWVAPLRISEKARIHPGTRKILEIRVSPLP